MAILLFFANITEGLRETLNSTKHLNTNKKYNEVLEIAWCFYSWLHMIPLFKYNINILRTDTPFLLVKSPIHMDLDIVCLFTRFNDK
jgi:hypothetical protein